MDIYFVVFYKGTGLRKELIMNQNVFINYPLNPDELHKYNFFLHCREEVIPLHLNFNNLSNKICIQLNKLIDVNECEKIRINNIVFDIEYTNGLVTKLTSIHID
jgi:hypothetical protein